MNLIQRFFNSVPDCIKVRILELTNDEEWFLETSKEANEVFWRSRPNTSIEDIRRCEYLKSIMEHILNYRYKNERLDKHFSELINRCSHNIRQLSGYR
jgi:hypothetical protein